MNEALALVAIVLVAVSGIPGVFLARQSSLGERLAALLMVMGSTCGLVSAFGVAASNGPGGLSLPWSVPGPARA